MRVAASIQLTVDERATLERWARGRTIQARLVLRAKIVLAAAAGKENREIAAELGTLQKTVSRWRRRFATSRLEGFDRDAPRGGRPSTIRQAMSAKIIIATSRPPPPPMKHWSTRSLARHLGTSPSMVQRVWKENNLEPRHRRSAEFSGENANASGFVDQAADKQAPTNASAHR